MCEYVNLAVQQHVLRRPGLHALAWRTHQQPQCCAVDVMASQTFHWTARYNCKNHAQEHLGCTLSLEGHTDIVLTLDTLEVAAEGNGGAPARTLLLSGSKDNSMRLWEAPSGRCLGEINSKFSKLYQVAVRYLAGGTTASCCPPCLCVLPPTWVCRAANATSPFTAMLVPTECAALPSVQASARATLLQSAPWPSHAVVPSSQCQAAQTSCSR